ncbi:ABC transporter permease [Streptomyces sp. NBS 14/10]|uniref:ABC transporter permease n=1 Tax=Streptomyces sp. NBS 14/10 TaxID=1945643 RepID=UPI000B7F2352|nr:ABC transporter permease [Streptomyces sp. NBS 14/10]KAK1177196.1 ABC transporter permease [Streptomyces sp. NBS 14/10]NUP39216.1 ABC transporter permease [Streptomyces sp.]NUS86602.1 ABC transporter permease [Streptomyces sp.]
MSQNLVHSPADTADTAEAAPGLGQPADTGTGPGPGHRVDVRRGLRFLLRRPGLLLSVAVVVLVVLASFRPDLFTSQDPLKGVPSRNFRGPSGTHWFGTDELGRDVFSRVVHGAQLSLKATLIAVLVAFVVGGLLGVVAGFVGRWVDDVLMRFVDVLLSIPALFLSLALVTALGYGTVKVAVAVGIASVAAFARVARAEVLRVRQAVFVEASRSCGARWYSVLGRHVLPNAAGPVIVLATLDFGSSILAVSALSFLGYGAPPPAPEWGTLISDGRNYLANAWWLTALPGLAIAATVLATNRIARALDGEWSRQR